MPFQVDIYKLKLDYRYDRVLGGGGEGTLTLYRHKQTDQPVVIKDYKLSKYSGNPPEPKVLSKLDHPNIVKMHGQNGNLVALEYCDLGDLENYKNKCTNHYFRSHRRVPESFIWHVLYDLTKALAYLHEGYGTGHYGKGPFDPPVIKLADFGGSTMPGVCEDPNNEWYGSIDYWPPECSLIDPKADVWALGAVVYFLATGSPPIDPHGPLSELGGFRTKLDSISADAHGHPHRGGYSEALQAVLYEILLVDPDMRIGAVKLLENLQQLYIDALNMCKKDEVTTNNDFYPDLPRVIQRLAERLAEEDEDDSDTEMDTDEDEDCSTSWLWMYRPSSVFSFPT